MISIIIPSYNTEKYIVETLTSIQSQTYTDFECIIVDDLSSDQTFQLTMDFCLKDCRFKIVNRPISYPKGANACRAYGYSQISKKSNYILFFDSDDIMSHQNIEKKIESLRGSNDLNCCFSLVGSFSGDFSTNKDYTSSVYYKRFFSNDIFWEFANFKIVFYYINGVFKREYLDNLFIDRGINYFINPDLPCYQDYFLFLMLLKEGMNYSLIDEPHVFYRDRTGSISSQFQEYNTDKSKKGIKTLIWIRDYLAENKLKNNEYDLVINSYMIRFSRQYFVARKFNDSFNFFILSVHFIVKNLKSTSYWRFPLQLFYITTGKLGRYIYE